MLNSQVILPVVTQTLVEGRVLLGGNILRVPSPQRLGLVELLVFSGGLLDLLGLLWLVLVVDFLDLGGLVGVLGNVLGVVIDLLLDLLGDGELDGV